MPTEWERELRFNSIFSTLSIVSNQSNIYLDCHGAHDGALMSLCRIRGREKRNRSDSRYSIQECTAIKNRQIAYLEFPTLLSGFLVRPCPETVRKQQEAFPRFVPVL